MTKPATKPARPFFSSGPCVKRPGWTLAALDNACLGRSHRSKPGKAKLARAIDETRALLSIPEAYRIAIVPASDTGAIEMALWSLLGARGVDVLSWDAFGEDWVADIETHMKLDDVRILRAPYGELPDLSQTSHTRDTVFLWNGTTSGVRVPDGAWIADNREGLTLCDATSAIFAQALPWEKLDVVTFSWQKVLGGEAAHGMLILSPRAVERLETYTPPRALPKIFRMTKGGKLVEGLFRGETINTPSLLCVEDYLDALGWARREGGLQALCARADANLKAIADWVAGTGWVDFLCRDARTRSNTSVCLKLADAHVSALADADQRAFVKRMAALLEAEGAAYDVDGYRRAPPGLRLWAGASVERADLDAVFPWLDWAYDKARQEIT